MRLTHVFLARKAITGSMGFSWDVILAHAFTIAHLGCHENGQYFPVFAKVVGIHERKGVIFRIGVKKCRSPKKDCEGVISMIDYFKKEQK